MALLKEMEISELADEQQFYESVRQYIVRICHYCCNYFMYLFAWKWFSNHFPDRSKFQIVFKVFKRFSKVTYVCLVVQKDFL